MLGRIPVMPARRASPAVLSNGRILIPSVIMIESDTKSQAETGPKTLLPSKGDLGNRQGKLVDLARRRH